MEPVELADLGSRATYLVGRVQAGEEFVITDLGRPVAKLIPVTARTWRSWNEVAELFAGPEILRPFGQGILADEPRDPWNRPDAS